MRGAMTAEELDLIAALKPNPDLARLTYYRQTLGHQPGDFPNAEYIGARTLSLSAKLTGQNVEDVVGPRGHATAGLRARGDAQAVEGPAR